MFICDNYRSQGHSIDIFEVARGEICGWRRDRKLLSVAGCAAEACIGHRILGSLSFLLVCKRVACTDSGSILVCSRGSGGARCCRHVRIPPHLHMRTLSTPRKMDEIAVIGSGYDDHVEHARWTDDVGHKGCLIIKTTGSM